MASVPGMFWTALQRGHFTARIPGGAVGRPGFWRMTMTRPMMPRSPPRANDPPVLRFFFWPIKAAIAPKARHRTTMVHKSRRIPHRLKYGSTAHWTDTVQSASISRETVERVRRSLRARLNSQS